MIVDTLSHIWESPEQLGRRTERRRGPGNDRLLHASPTEHFENLGPVDVALVLGFNSRLLGAAMPNKLVADYARSHPDRIIAVASVDPTAGRPVDRIEHALDELGCKAIAISPSAQGFHPMDSSVQPLYRRLIQRDVPLFVYPGPCPAAESRLEFANPVLLDEVLRTHEGLRLVVGNLGSPWTDQTIALMGKHPRVFATIGGLLVGPWQAYRSLVLAHENGLMDRLLFSSDFPFGSAVTCIETLYSLNLITQGTNLPSVPREQLRGVVERDALSLLGIAAPAAAESPAPGKS